MPDPNNPRCSTPGHSSSQWNRFRPSQDGAHPLPQEKNPYGLPKSNLPPPRGAARKYRTIPVAKSRQWQRTLPSVCSGSLAVLCAQTRSRTRGSGRQPRRKPTTIRQQEYHENDPRVPKIYFRYSYEPIDISFLKEFSRELWHARK